MKSDTVEFWDDIWSTMDQTFPDHDELLAEHTGTLKPGRALDLGCGSGSNAVWLAERGWQVTAVDFSSVAIEKGRHRAARRRVEVDFVVSEVLTYRPTGVYDLIISFYIQLWPRQRAQMLSRAAEVLAPRGKILFVSHDRSSPPSGWTQGDMESLTVPDEVVAELPGLSIERAEVAPDKGRHSENMEVSQETEEEDGHGLSHRLENEPGLHDASSGATTLVVGVKEK